MLACVSNTVMVEAVDEQVIGGIRDAILVRIDHVRDFAAGKAGCAAMAGLVAGYAVPEFLPGSLRPEARCPDARPGPGIDRDRRRSRFGTSLVCRDRGGVVKLAVTIETIGDQICGGHDML